MNEFQGRWVRRGLVQVPIIEEPEPPVRRREPTPPVWDHPRMREAHRLFMRGHTDARTLEGERLYQRDRKRLQRAGLSVVDRRWCERQEVLASWRPIYYSASTTNG